MTDAIREQILAVRATGETNMFDIPCVQKVAFDLEFYELVMYLEDDRQGYAQFILSDEE